MKKYLFLLYVVFFCGCFDIEPKSSNAHIVHTSQVHFTSNDNPYFIHSTYLGQYCEDEWYKVLNNLPIKTKPGVTPKCNLKHFFIMEFFTHLDPPIAIVINDNISPFYLINKADILSNILSHNNHSMVYLVTTEPFKDAQARIEVLLESGQFASLVQQILSKSLFFHQEDLSK